MGKPMETAIALDISDVTGQKTVHARDVPQDASVGELIEGVLAEMRLPRNDSAGRALTYHARLDREGRHLNGAERVGDSLESGDQVVLQPNIDAGSGAPCP